MSVQPDSSHLIFFKTNSVLERISWCRNFNRCTNYTCSKNFIIVMSKNENLLEADKKRVFKPHLITRQHKSGVTKLLPKFSQKKKSVKFQVLKLQVVWAITCNIICSKIKPPAEPTTKSLHKQLIVKSTKKMFVVQKIL
eukprot:TRINITY_DN26443_c0_g1_i3.p2 TRINITY_DN26443_c0_g1~~TRINITY_DN26443_c0_g1_i3.p2  ORF type:complete len:139 (+),score=5.08 TRINITY_DN26443_c0_g1_i3:1446-1862(+)